MRAYIVCVCVCVCVCVYCFSSSQSVTQNAENSRLLYALRCISLCIHEQAIELSYLCRPGLSKIILDALYNKNGQCYKDRVLLFRGGGGGRS